MEIGMHLEMEVAYLKGYVDGLLDGSMKSSSSWSKRAAILPRPTAVIFFLLALAHFCNQGIEMPDF